jgi:hypothetical protein
LFLHTVSTLPNQSDNIKIPNRPIEKKKTVSKMFKIIFDQGDLTKDNPIVASNNIVNRTAGVNQDKLF